MTSYEKSTFHAHAHAIGRPFLVILFHWGSFDPILKWFLLLLGLSSGGHPGLNKFTRLKLHLF